ncbi:MAG: hypothetical protein CEN90_237 [Parcubacteria group bacterium Licking1014_17]|nr:MAG: hypothetical protein CEN90_237 [Parcubacteria group bacterium Licking1014_17]
MELVEDDGSKEITGRAQSSIAKFGYAPEHNLEWFHIYSSPKEKRYFAFWPGGEMLFLTRRKKEWCTFSEPIAPILDGGRKIIDFCGEVFKSPETEKFWTEVSETVRRQILQLMPKNLRARPIAYTLVWPIMNMDKFDPALPGSHFKSIRNAKSKFYREHKVEILDISKTPKEELYRIVDEWKKHRKYGDRAYAHEYHSIIDANFRCAKTARAMIVGGRVVGFNAGWPIPNSTDFYAAIGIHDYSVHDLGLMLYLEDLEWLKKAGYKTVDMGGVEKGSPLDFKKQFLPARYYKTFVFSIGRK